ncbi:MAG TPA: RecX family transcriptional regulator [Coriobacteriia bacterium]
MTEILIPRRGARRRELTVDGEPWRATSADVLSTLGIRVGFVSPLDDLAASLDATEPRSARERALRLLSYRDRTASELVDRLEQDGYPRGVAADVVADLLHSGLVDDERLATAAAHTLTRVRGFGRARAERELRSRGVDPALAQVALDEALPPEDELDAARALARALATRPGADAGRIATRLVRKGYRQALAIRVAREVVATDGTATSDGFEDTGSDLLVSDD